MVTLLVTPEDAEALTLANIEGRIQLVLRNSSDAVLANPRGRQLNDLYGPRTAPAAAAPPMAVAVPRRERPAVPPHGGAEGGVSSRAEADESR